MSINRGMIEYVVCVGGYSYETDVAAFPKRIVVITHPEENKSQGHEMHGICRKKSIFIKSVFCFSS